MKSMATAQSIGGRTSAKKKSSHCDQLGRAKKKHMPKSGFDPEA